MLYAVKQYKDFPDSPEMQKGIPPEWVKESFTVDYIVPEGYTSMTIAEYNELIIQWLPSYKSWYITQQDYLGQVIDQKIRDAEQFGKNIASRFKIENVKMGATQLGKSGDILAAVSEKLPLPSGRKISFIECLESGTITACIPIIDYMLLHISDYSDISTFINTERLAGYRLEILNFLGM